MMLKDVSVITATQESTVVYTVECFIIVINRVISVTYFSKLLH